ncbi:hypothetical protein AVEN_49489-1, partial [Araneus ventricosus]
IKNQNEDKPNEREDVLADLVSHADAVSTLELLLCQAEQHPASTPVDLMFMLCWNNIRSSSRFSSLCQKKTTDFV